MRNIEYLSPTSLSIWAQNPTEFYLNYLSENRPPKFAQTQPMSVGSSFDAHAKSYLHEGLFGKGFDPKYDLMALFEAQVESHNRDFAWEAGAYVFEKYKESGALSDLMLELQQAIGPPRFEFEVRGVVAGKREGQAAEIGNVTFLGKPDIFFLSKTGAHVIFDWKVNGYLSKYTVSPMMGYVRLRENGRNQGQHKNAQLMNHHGMMINVAAFLEHVNEDWARQLAIYAWLCGEEVGGDFIVAVDQIVCKPVGGPRPHIRVAEHRLRVHHAHQRKIYEEAAKCWEIVHSDHIFRDMTKEDSQARCLALDGTKAALEGDGSDNDRLFAAMTRG